MAIPSAKTNAFLLVWTLAALSSTRTLAQEGSEKIIGGTFTSARPEVGTVNGGGCTATLIGRRWALTASHCMGHFSLFWPTATGRSTFSVDPPAGPRQSFQIERAYSLGFPIGPKDVMLLRLATNVPTSLVPNLAMIATAPPASGSLATIFGYGCGASLNGSKQVGTRTLTIGSFGEFMTSSILCPGDSGGPAFTGAGMTTGPVFGVNSQILGSTDLYGDVVRRRFDIADLMSSAEIAGTADITMSGWCTGSSQALYYGDINGDSFVDGICHDESTGRVGYARGTRGAIVPQGEWAGPFCSHATAQLHVGDFNADRRTDLLCIDRVDGRKWVDLSTGNWSAPYGTIDFAIRDLWCTHASAEVHVGDFNGDRRSDLLCHDNETGQKRIDYASPVITALFGTNDYDDVHNWCSHDTATLLVSDFTGDGLSDILCHTKWNGTLDVKHARLGSVFDAPEYWHWQSPGFCLTPSARLAAFDMTEDGRAELYCLHSGGGGSLLIAMGEGGVPFRPDISWTWGAWGQAFTRPLIPGNVASQPWARRR